MKREVQYPIKYLSYEEWNRLDALPKSPRDDLILNILYSTGCTVNELVNIRIRQIDFKKNTLQIRKESSRNKHARDVYISKKVIEKITSTSQGILISGSP